MRHKAAHLAAEYFPSPSKQRRNTQNNVTYSSLPMLFFPSNAFITITPFPFPISHFPFPVSHFPFPFPSLSYHYQSIYSINPTHLSPITRNAYNSNQPPTMKMSNQHIHIKTIFPKNGSFPCNLLVSISCSCSHSHPPFPYFL